MSKLYYAAIDVGSNAVRLLIKSLDTDNPDREPQKEQLFRVPLRLGTDAFTKGKIGKKKSKRLFHLMEAYKELMEVYDVEEYRACATSAMRDAENGAKLVDKIYKDTGIDIEIIDGREEAELISKDLIGNFSISEEDIFLYVDVGGGSTELNLLLGKKLIASHSFNIGTVRMLSASVEDTEVQRLKDYVHQIARKYKDIQIVGSGGNINKLLRLGKTSERNGSIGFLPTDELTRLSQELKKYEFEERIQLFNLKPDRADVIIPASEIFLMITDIVEPKGIIVPTKGLSDGIIDWLCLHYAKSTTNF